MTATSERRAERRAHIATLPDQIWMVEVYGYVAEPFRAKTRDQARYRAYLQFCDAFGRRSFRDFTAKGVRIRPANALESST